MSDTGYNPWKAAWGNYQWAGDGATPPAGHYAIFANWTGLGGPDCYDNLLQAVAETQAYTSTVTNITDWITYWLAEEVERRSDCSLIKNAEDGPNWGTIPSYGDWFVTNEYSNGYLVIEDYTLNESFGDTPGTYQPDVENVYCEDENVSAAGSTNVISNNIEEAQFTDCGGEDTANGVYYMGDSGHTTTERYITYPDQYTNYFVPSALTNSGASNVSYWVSCSNYEWYPSCSRD
jgi:hypothetical protein